MMYMSFEFAPTTDTAYRNAEFTRSFSALAAPLLSPKLGVACPALSWLSVRFTVAMMALTSDGKFVLIKAIAHDCPELGVGHE